MENGTGFGKRKGESSISAKGNVKSMYRKPRVMGGRPAGGVRHLSWRKSLCRFRCSRSVLMKKGGGSMTPARQKKSPANLTACGALNGEADGT